MIDHALYLSSVELAQILIYLRGKNTSHKDAFLQMEAWGVSITRHGDSFYILKSEAWSFLSDEYSIVLSKRKIYSLEELYASAYYYFHHNGGMILYLSR